MLNVIAMVRQAVADPVMREAARRKLATMLTQGDLLAEYPANERKRAIFPSDFGSCALALWAEKHGLSDIPRDPIDENLARLDLGSLIGAWEACLLWAACNADKSADGWGCEIEHVPEGGGHIDALLTNRATGERVPIEFKSTYSSPTSPIKPPEKENTAHILQVSDYAGRVGATRVVLPYIKPPASAGDRMRQYELDVAPWIALAKEERVRLAPALGDDPPVADPQNRWSCFTCRYSPCPKNKNKAANSAELLFA